MSADRCEVCRQVAHWGDHSKCREEITQPEPEVGPVLTREKNLERVRALKDQFRKVKT